MQTWSSKPPSPTRTALGNVPSRWSNQVQRFHVAKAKSFQQQIESIGKRSL